MAETADVAVVGLGAVGAAALHRLALAGARVVGIDRHRPPHAFGSSHGETRITRLAVGEGAAYAPLVRRSHAIWRELEALSGEALFDQCGGLVLGPREAGPVHHGTDDFVRHTLAVGRANGVAVEELDAAEIGARFQQFILRGDEIGSFEPTAGMVFPERCVAVQLRLAEEAGAAVHVDEVVTGIESSAGGVAITTDRRVVHAGSAVLAAGAWLPGLAGLGERAQVYRQTLHWFPVDDPAAYAPGRFPVFIWMHGHGEGDYSYGFPALPGAATVKVGTEHYAAAVDPDRIDRVVGAAETAEMFRRHVAGHLRGVGPAAERSSVCMYTVTPDAGFIIDRMEGQPNVLFASACSGHGFKHSAAVGELLAERALGEAQDAVNPFALARLS